jgi:Protein of unknown function (DUF1439)
VSLRRTLILGLPLTLLLACSQLGGPRVITLSEADIATRLARVFPLDQRLLEVLDVRVQTPQVRLLPETNRLATELDLQATDRLFGRSTGGHLAMDSALRYDAQEGAVRLSHVRVSQLRLDSGEARLQGFADRLAPLIAEKLLENLAIYRFKPEDLQKVEASGLQPGAVTVTARGVEVTLAKPK